MRTTGPFFLNKERKRKSNSSLSLKSKVGKEAKELQYKGNKEIHILMS